MMSNSDFAEETAFERLVLDRLVPIMSPHSTEEIDLREAITSTGQINLRMSFSSSMSGQEVAKATLSVMPLLFGAAWKIFDLMLELALHLRREPSEKRHWTIQEKKKIALSGELRPLPLFSTEKNLWNALCKIYAVTVEHRHCLVHRTACFSETPLLLSGKDKSGEALRPLAASELEAFVRAAQLAASTIISGKLDSRNAKHLRYELDQLKTHTNIPLNGSRACTPTLVRMCLTHAKNDKLQADFAYVCRKSKELNPHKNYDILIDIPDSSNRKLFARLEDLPESKVIIDLENLPPYLSLR